MSEERARKEVSKQTSEQENECMSKSVNQAE